MDKGLVLSCWIWLWLAGQVGLAGVAAVGPGSSAGEAATYTTAEVSLADSNPWTFLLNAQVTPYLGPAPEPGVKVYPKFISTRPAYGRVIFDRDLLHDTFLTYYFALDESGGTGSGYDRLHLDTNCDADLTNDPVIEPAGPAHRLQNTRKLFFGPVAVDFKYPAGQGVFRQEVLASLTITGGSVSVAFSIPVVHRARITLGRQSVEAVLMQTGTPTLTGAFDRPGTTLCLAGGDWEPLCRWRRFGDTLYAFSATAAGDRLTVRPYTGAWGLLQDGGDVHGLKIEEGMIRSDTAILDLNDLRDGAARWRIPVGDYRPSQRIIAKAGAVRVTLGPYRDPCDVDGPSRPPVFFMKIREGRPCSLALDSRPQIVFQSPQAGVAKAGQELRIVAAIYDPVKDVQVLDLEDTLRSETIDLPRQRPYRRFARLDPTVVITDSSKTVVSQGKMPFG
jgi:hypothetical protein